MAASGRQRIGRLTAGLRRTLGVWMQHRCIFQRYRFRQRAWMVVDRIRPDRQLGRNLSAAAVQACGTPKLIGNAVAANFLRCIEPADFRAVLLRQKSRHPRHAANTGKHPAYTVRIRRLARRVSCTADFQA